MAFFAKLWIQAFTRLRDVKEDPLEVESVSIVPVIGNGEAAPHARPSIAASSL